MLVSMSTDSDLISFLAPSSISIQRQRLQLPPHSTISISAMTTPLPIQCLFCRKKQLDCIPHQRVMHSIIFWIIGLNPGGRFADASESVQYQHHIDADSCHGCVKQVPLLEKLSIFLVQYLIRVEACPFLQ